ncbi:MAG: hypothetical protein JW909_04245 [Planctomycetes bacterium]|nr:hypothetical protein [Planctomycetota bacterium]
MTSRERLLAVMNGVLPDRVPVSTYELAGWNSAAWENSEPSYSRLMDYIRRNSDCIAMWGPSWSNAGLGGLFTTWTDTVDAERETWMEGERRVTRTVVHTPGGDITAVDANDPGIYTTWHLEHFCKSAEDVERVLSIPYEFVPPSFDDLPRIRSEVADRGIIMPSIADPLCIAAELFAMSDFTIFAFTERDLFKAVLDAMLPRVMDVLAAMLEAEAGDMYRVVGPEYASEPYLPPELFAEFVVPYDRPMCDLIRSYGRYARLHSHGRLKNNLDSVVATNCNGIDPAEPPPDGDVTIADIRGQYPDLGIFGNIELKVLEHGSPEDVRSAVSVAMEHGKPGGRFCLMPTAAPINVPLAEKTADNYILYMDTARRLGQY